LANTDVVTAGTGLRAGTSADLALPTFKGRPGWEFTDLTGLDVDAYAAGSLLLQLGTAAPLWTLPDAVVPGSDLPAGVELTETAEQTVVRVARGVIVEQPISIVRVQASSGTRVNHRTVIDLAEGAQAEIWEQQLSASEEIDGLFNFSTEVTVGDGAHLRYVCGQGLSERTWVLGAQRATVGRSASLDWVALGFGSRSGHVIMNTRLAGEGADARVTG